jgi:hypothetical protein
VQVVPGLTVKYRNCRAQPGHQDKPKTNQGGICKRVKIAPQSPPVSCEVLEAIVKTQGGLRINY